MPLVEVKGRQVYYELHGVARGVPLALVMGMGGSCRGWLALQVPELARRHRTLIFDHRGAGGSSDPGGPFDTAQMADDLKDLLGTLGFERADVLGVFMGGMVAQELALRHPRCVERLVLVGTFARPDAKRRLLLEQWRDLARAGASLETLLRERLLAPLGMVDTYIATRPPNVRVAQGHFSNTLPAKPWNFHIDMSGAGGVRATLPDMVRYLEGQLGTRESRIGPALARTQLQVARIGRHTMGMNWEFLSTPNILNGRTIINHAGGTGGYSSFVAFDRAAKRGVVLLSDTALTDLGGLNMLGLHLLDPSRSAGTPRTAAVADVKLIDALAGRYRFQDGQGIEVRRKGNALTIQADSQPEFETGYDSAGDFYPLQFDALMRPKRKADGTYAFTWFQLGGARQAERLGKPAPVAAAWTPTEEQLREYEGNYPLSPTFALRVFSEGSKLSIQGTNQSPLEVAAVEKDVFVAESVDAEIDFERDAGGRVTALTLKQRGQVSRGERH